MWVGLGGPAGVPAEPRWPQSLLLPAGILKLELTACHPACSCLTPVLSLAPLLSPRRHRCLSACPQIQFTINQWLLQHGFSIGIGDLIADQRTMEIINDIMNKAKGDVKKLIEKIQVGGWAEGGGVGCLF